MDIKKYKIYDHNTLLAVVSGFDVLQAFLLGYREQFYDEPLDLRIEEILEPADE